MINYIYLAKYYNYRPNK